MTPPATHSLDRPEPRSDAARGNVSLAERVGMSFAPGSMATTIEGCRRFVAATGHPATTGLLTDAAALLAGTAGTTIAVAKRPLATSFSERHPITARTSA